MTRSTATRAKSDKSKKPDEKNRGGRPSLYTPQIIEKIVAGLSQGTPLTVICSEPGMPNDDTVRDWGKKMPEVSRAIARGRELGFDKIALEAIAIADDGRSDTITTDDGREIQDKEWIQRSKLRVETRLKLLAKWDPKRYGEMIKHSNDPDNPMPTGVIVVPAKKVSANA